MAATGPRIGLYLLEGRRGGATCHQGLSDSPGASCPWASGKSKRYSSCGRSLLLCSAFCSQWGFGHERSPSHVLSRKSQTLAYFVVYWRQLFRLMKLRRNPSSSARLWSLLFKAEMQKSRQASPSHTFQHMNQKRGVLRFMAPAQAGIRLYLDCHVASASGTNC